MFCVGIFLKIETHEVVCPLCMVRKNMFLKATVSMLWYISKGSIEIVISGLNLGLKTRCAEWNHS